MVVSRLDSNKWQTYANIDFKLVKIVIWQILETMKTDLIENDVFTKIQNKTEVSHKI